MILPLRDINPTRRPPVLTWALIAANVVVWLYEVSLGQAEMQLAVDRWGVVPHFLLVEPSVGAWMTPVTSLFLHAGWAHLLWNMWFLHVFGDNIEDELGRGRFLLFYLLCGLGAVAAQVAIDPTGRTPMVGASGAIAGVLGGYMMLHPRAPIVTLVLVFFVQLPAWIFLFVWFGLQLLEGFTSLGLPGNTGGVAFFAHIGGFVVGAAMVHRLRRPADPDPSALPVAEHPA